MGAPVAFEPVAPASGPALDPEESLDALMRDLGRAPPGLSVREAERRLQQFGPNEIPAARAPGTWPRSPASSPTRWRCCCGRRPRSRWWRGSPPWRSRSSPSSPSTPPSRSSRSSRPSARRRRSRAFLPPHARVRARRRARSRSTPATWCPATSCSSTRATGSRADARLVDGLASRSTCRRSPASRSRSRGRAPDARRRRRAAARPSDLVFAGTLCTGGEAQAVVYATGDGTRSSAASPRCPSASRPRSARCSAGQPGRLADRRRSRSAPARRPSCRRRRWSPACRSATRRCSRSACSSPTCPRACCRRSRSRWRSACAGWRAARRAGQAAHRGRDARLDRRDLHRQDRHADREPHGGRALWADGAESPRPRRRTATAASVRGAARDRRALQQRAPGDGGDGWSAAATRARARCCWPPRRSGVDVGAPGRARARRAAASTSTRACKRMTTLDDGADGALVRTPRARRWSCCRAAPRCRGATARAPARRAPSAPRSRRAVERYAAPGAARARLRRAALDARRAGRATRDAAESRPHASSGWPRCSTRRAPTSPTRSRAATRAGIRIIVITGDHGLTAAAIAARRSASSPTTPRGRHRRRARRA